MKGVAIWDYMKMNQKPQKSDCIIGQGTEDINVAKTVAKLYFEGFVSIIKFNTSSLSSFLFLNKVIFEISDREVSGRRTLGFGTPMLDTDWTRL